MAGESWSRGNGRKRTRPSFLLEDNTPSDPALFSSDPPDPSVDHYFSPRHKRQYRGTWWQDGERPRKARKAFTRNMDSGVFMGSDSSTESVGLEGLQHPRSDDTVPDESLDLMKRVKHVPSSQTRKPVRISEPTSVYEARALINRFVENDAFELRDGEYRHVLTLRIGDLGLPYLTDDMISPLQHKIMPPRWATRSSRRRGGGKRNNRMYRTNRESSSDDDISSLDSDADLDKFEPTFDLNLNGNALTHLPPTLYSISGIASLSVRNNNLQTLSPNIAQMAKLKDLDLRGNRLRWLPGEVVDLRYSTEQEILLTSFALNPLVQPFSFVGFHQRVRDAVDKDEEALHLVPSSVGAIRRRIEKLRQPLSSAIPDNDTQQRSFVQTRWLMRLYEHFESVPEMIWLDWTTDPSLRKDVSSEEEAAIRDSWTTGAYLETAGSPLDDVLLNLSVQMGRALRHSTFIIAASPVCYLDLAGHPVDQAVSLPSQLPLDESILPARLLKVPERRTSVNKPVSEVKSLSRQASKDSPRSMVEHSYVHSLFSSCLRSAISVPEFRQLPYLLPDDVSYSVASGLRTAIQNREDGGRTCSTCKRSYVIPRAEWIEYHHIHDRTLRRDIGKAIENVFIPFLRNVCSWACVPNFEFDD